MRLMEGLAEWEPDPQARAEHILRRMLHGVGMTRVHAEMTRRSLYVSRDASSEHSIVRFDTVEGNVPFVQAEHDYPTNKAGSGFGFVPGVRRPGRVGARGGQGELCVRVHPRGVPDGGDGRYEVRCDCR